VRHGIRRVKIL